MCGGVAEGWGGRGAQGGSVEGTVSDATQSRFEAGRGNRACCVPCRASTRYPLYFVFFISIYFFVLRCVPSRALNGTVVFTLEYTALESRWLRLRVLSSFHLDEYNKKENVFFSSLCSFPLSSFVFHRRE